MSSLQTLYIVSALIALAAAILAYSSFKKQSKRK